MIINLGWKDIQKKYVVDKGISKNKKNKIQKFMTESNLKSIVSKNVDKVIFTFEYEDKEYQALLIGNRTCRIARDMFFEFGFPISKEITPYLREYKNKYLNKCLI